MANSTADLSVMEIRKTSIETKGLSIQGHPGLKIKFQDSQGYVMRHGLNTKTKQKTENGSRSPGAAAAGICKLPFMCKLTRPVYAFNC